MTTPTLTDLKTSEGARQYLADYFSSVIGNHFFKDYISEALAADFACTLSQHLAALAAQPDCLTCNDHGAVGNVLNAEPCPALIARRLALWRSRNLLSLQHGGTAPHFHCTTGTKM